MRGNPFTEEVKALWRERFGARQVGGNGYGLTEAAVVTSLAGGEYAAPGSSGKRVPDFDVRIVDDVPTARDDVDNRFWKQDDRGRWSEGP